MTYLFVVFARYKDEIRLPTWKQDRHRFGLYALDQGLERTMEGPKDPRPSKKLTMLVYRCPACQSFVAASRDRRLIEIAQSYHVCPESIAFAARNQQLKRK